MGPLGSIVAVGVDVGIGVPLDPLQPDTITNTITRAVIILNNRTLRIFSNLQRSLLTRTPITALINLRLYEVP
ncbi:MAG: hypothetical protein JSW38_08825 [Dehalococcoidia bacterium]|nr:MAG: hypothetical protein JSW38_08825 [Dehalococcoidia bacterium]